MALSRFCVPPREVVTNSHNSWWQTREPSLDRRKPNFNVIVTTPPLFKIIQEIFNKLLFRHNKQMLNSIFFFVYLGLMSFGNEGKPNGKLHFRWRLSFPAVPLMRKVSWIVRNVALIFQHFFHLINCSISCLCYLWHMWQNVEKVLWKMRHILC